MYGSGAQERAARGVYGLGVAGSAAPGDAAVPAGGGAAGGRGCRPGRQDPARPEVRPLLTAPPVTGSPIPPCFPDNSVRPLGRADPVQSCSLVLAGLNPKSVLSSWHHCTPAGLAEAC